MVAHCKKTHVVQINSGWGSYNTKLLTAWDFRPGPSVSRLTRVLKLSSRWVTWVRIPGHMNFTGNVLTMALLSNLFTNSYEQRRQHFFWELLEVWEGESWFNFQNGMVHMCTWGAEGSTLDKCIHWNALHWIEGFLNIYGIFRRACKINKIKIKTL